MMAVVYNVPIVMRMDTYCCTCLSTDRKLSSFAKIPLLADWQNIGLNNSNGFVCWECRAMFMKILQFRKQVIYASQWAAIGNNIQSLSRLGVTINENEYTFTEKEQCVEIKLDGSVLVKQEPADYTEVEVGYEPKLEDQYIKCEPVQDEICPTNRQYHSSQVINTTYTQSGLDKLDKGSKALPKPKIKDNKECKSQSVDIKSRYSKITITKEDLLKYWDLQQKFYRRDFCKGDVFRCDLCLLTFDHSTILDEHQAEFHSEINQYVCDICSSRFEDQNTLDEHKNTHKSIYKCNTCKYRHIQESIMINHIKMQHNKESYVCKLCNAEFRSRWKLGRHQAYHKEKKQVECEICKKIILKKSLKSHIMHVHATPESHQCSTCNKSYKSAKKLEVHKANYHKEWERVMEYHCVECKMFFSNKQRYQEHMTTSRKHNDYAFGCNLCKKSFLTESNLQRHTEAVHLRLNLFTCDHCGISCCRKYALLKHLRTKHDKSYKGRPRDKICDVCGKAFYCEKILATHYLRHTGERPHKCDICGADFRQPGSLYTHNKLVHLKIKRNLKKKVK